MCELALDLFTSFPSAPSVSYGVQHSAAIGMWGFLAFHFYARADARKSPLYDPRGYLAAAPEEAGGSEALLPSGGGEDGGAASRPRHVVWGGALAERIPPASSSQQAAPPAYTLM